MIKSNQNIDSFDYYFTVGVTLFFGIQVPHNLMLKFYVLLSLMFRKG